MPAVTLWIARLFCRSYTFLCNIALYVIQFEWKWCPVVPIREPSLSCIPKSPLKSIKETRIYWFSFQRPELYSLWQCSFVFMEWLCQKAFGEVAGLFCICGVESSNDTNGRNEPWREGLLWSELELAFIQLPSHPISARYAHLNRMESMSITTPREQK